TDETVTDETVTDETVTDETVTDETVTDEMVADEIIVESEIQELEEREKEEEPLPDDLQDILDIIRSHDGRMTQKELRGRLKYSEGKVSLMLFDLEKRGSIEKFKRGRGNVIILVDKKD
ncbi:MAG: winged helix-turn-helix transcriptional regulator, partial [Methanosarcinaceae archaeon]|nr:winged helix-turn-helix transcriptional regulator [Methanosarcinaceae archaeon]